MTWTDQITGEVRKDRPSWAEYAKQVKARGAATLIRGRLRPHVGVISADDLARFASEVADSAGISPAEGRSVVLRELTLLRDEVDKRQDTVAAQMQDEQDRLRERIGPVVEDLDAEGLLPSRRFALMVAAVARSDGISRSEAESQILEAFPGMRDDLQTELAAFGLGDDVDRERFERLNAMKGRTMDDGRNERAAEALDAELDRLAQAKVDAGEVDSLVKARVVVRRELPKLAEFERTLAGRVGSAQVEKGRGWAERAEEAIDAKARSLHGSADLWNTPLAKLRVQVRKKYPEVAALTRRRGEVRKADVDVSVVQFLDEWAPR